MFRSRDYPPPFFHQPNWPLRWLGLAIVAGVTAALGAYAFEVGKRLAGATQPLFEAQALNKISLDQLQQQVSTLDAELKAQKSLNTQASSASDLERTVSGLQREVAEMVKRQARIEAALLADPAKALEVPLILRDLEAMKQNQQIAQAALRQDVERLFALGLGIAGIILTGLAGIFFSPRQLREEKRVG